MINKYFACPPTELETDILNCMTAELIQIAGINTFYIPRKLNRLDNLFGEDVLSEFNIKHEIEMYVNDVFEYGGEGDFMSNFGLEIRDEINLTVSSGRFFQATNIKVPREGDLIYIPRDNTLFEIKNVDWNKKFHAHNTTPKYDLKCELFEYSNEQIEVGISEIDALDGIDYKEDENGDLQAVDMDQHDNTSINDAIMAKFGDPFDENKKPTDETVDFLFDPDNPFG